MIKSITFLDNFRCFKKDETITFRPGLNLLVGEQGCGKSSVLSVIKENGKAYGKMVISYKADETKTRYFDFEKNNLRTQSALLEGDAIHLQISAMYWSHGETNKKLLGFLAAKETKGMTFLLDEPDMALSIRSCYHLVDLFTVAVKNGCQILAAVHNPILIAAADEVLSLEHKKWMTAKEFIAKHTEGISDQRLRKALPAEINIKESKQRGDSECASRTPGKTSPKKRKRKS